MLFVARFIPSGTLTHWIDATKTVPDADLHQQRLVFLGAIVAGMRVIHDSGLVHGNLNPNKVLMASENGVLVPKVAGVRVAARPGALALFEGACVWWSV